VKIIPSNLGTRTIHIELKINIGDGLYVGPKLSGRLVVIEKNDIRRMLCHGAEHVRRKTEIEDEYLAPRQAFRRYLVTVIDRLVFGAVSEAQPCRIGRAESIVTIGVIENQGI
jgi:hypothetical protein